MLHGPKSTQQLAKRLRREMTLPEVLLWQALRRRSAGPRFRRQHPAGRYVVDFYCPDHRIAVEVDGEAHNRGARPERDAERDAWLRRRGVRIFRFPAAEVLEYLDTVVHYVVAIAAPAASYPSTTFGGPPPPPGDE